MSVDDPGRDIQVWGWWIKGLGGLINIGEQIAAKFGKPSLATEVQRLQILGGARYTITDEFIIVDHQQGQVTHNGGKTWAKVEGS